MLGRCGWMLVAMISLFCLAPRGGFAQETAKPVEWLRGTGEALEMLVRGELVDAAGKPAEGGQLKAVMIDGDGTVADAAIRLEGARFEGWVPVGKSNWFGLHLDATSADGKQAASERIGLEDFHAAATEGVTLKLEAFQRTIEVKVVDKDAAVEGAVVEMNSVKRRGLRATTDKKGVARFGLLKNEAPSDLTAWTADHRLGGYQFDRQPPRDPHAASQVVELSPCRAQKIRFVQESDGRPLEGIEFSLQVATPSPHVNFILGSPVVSLKTNAQGEASYDWFPDWPRHHFYTEHLDKGWTKVGKESIASDGAIEVRVKPSRFSQRKKITGRLVSVDQPVGGFCIALQSFQGEEERRSDHLYAFTDAQGQFEVRVLPGSTYCLYAYDVQQVSEMVDVLAYDAAQEKAAELSLSLRKATPVEVTITQGPNQTPIEGQSVSFRAKHEYSWKENGKTRHGTGCRDWWAQTNAEGVIHTFAVPGKELEMNIYDPTWNQEQTVNVVDGTPVKVHFEKPLHVRRKLTGQLTLAAGLADKLEGAEISVSALDRGLEEELSIKADAEGKFQIETTANRFGLFAQTANRQAVAIAVVDATTIQGEFPLLLSAASELRGRLLGEKDAPLANYNIEASYTLETAAADQKLFRDYSVSAKPVKTDEKGEWTLSGVPHYAKTSLRGLSNDAAQKRYYIEELFLEPGEQRPRIVTKTAAQASTPPPLRERYATNLRDARLGGYRMLVVAFNPGSANEDFATQHFYDYEVNREVGAFMQAFYRTTGPNWVADDDRFAQEMKWPTPGEKNVIAIALDQTGKELGRLDLSVTDEAAAEKAARFLREHAAPPADAKKKWDEAFALAAKSDRKVWVRISQRYCGPCFALSRWLDDHKALLEKDYVLLKIDDVRDLHGIEVSKRLTVGDNRHHGVPFHAIFAADQQKQIDSAAGPLGNIGAPSGFEGGKQLRKMLKSTRARLTEGEIEELVGSLPE